jgi:hypothetical protein
MRPNDFHGTNSMTCANSVLPTFMRRSGFCKPRSIANRQSKIQIVDTLESCKTRVIIGFLAPDAKMNRTLMIPLIFVRMPRTFVRDQNEFTHAKQQAIKADLAAIKKALEIEQ